MNQDDIIAALNRTGALLKGHFKLRSGLHSDRYFQAALALQHTQVASQLCGILAERFRSAEPQTVISPAVGGIVVGQEVGRHLGIRAIFAEKDDQSELILRRGFTLSPGEKVLVAEDVITKGGRVRQTVDLVKAHGAEVIGIAVIVNRSAETIDFGAPLEYLVKLQLATYQPDNCPLCKQGIPIDKPGSK